MATAELYTESTGAHYELVTDPARVPGVLVAERDAIGELPAQGVSFLGGELRSK
jgi:hypothetical protein